jgi:DNA modification methylase
MDLPLNQVLLGDAIEQMRTLPDNSIDAIVSDPPYAEVDRDYGRLSEADWMDLMQQIVQESRRILKPTGSAIFILQPNCRKVGSMRLWLWKFMVWCGENWNIIQDVYWWNYAAIPTAPAVPRRYGLMRSSVKPCIWVGDANCYRQQEEVLWQASESTLKDLGRRAIRQESPSGHGVNRQRMAQATVDRGGATPFNLIPLTNSNSVSSSGAYGHGAGTPLELAKWWIRYICPPGGVILDPFMGAGTMALAAIEQKRNFIGIEKSPEYRTIALDRIAKATEAHESTRSA